MEWFLYINLFIIGVVTTLALQAWRAHRRQKATEKRLHLPKKTLSMPNALREQLLDQAWHEFETMLDRSRTELAHDLESTTTRLDKQLNELGTTVIKDELAKTEATVDQLRQSAETTIKAIEADMIKQQQTIGTNLNEYQAKLFGKLGEEAAAAQANLKATLDAKLSDAVASFLVETLRHDVDLGAQMPYLLKTLEEHKAELIAEVTNEA